MRLRTAAAVAALMCAAATTLPAPGPARAAEAKDRPREMSPQAKPTEYSPGLFRPDPGSVPYEGRYDPDAQYAIYGRKQTDYVPRPALEIGRPIYLEGPLGPTYNVIGEKNRLAPALAIYGDWRTAVAYNDNGARETGLVATRLNLEVDLKLTGTERIHAFFRPLDQDGKFTRYEFAGDTKSNFESEANGTIQNLFFEGDLGAIASGLAGEPAGYDLPFAVGFTPFFLQNGIWVDDAFIGGGFSITAKNSPALDISNMDFTVFGAADKLTTPGIRDALGRAEDRVAMIAATGFVEANRGYWEFGFGRLFDRGVFGDQDYYSIAAAFTRRYGSWLSNSVRAFGAFGQDRQVGRAKTANGVAVLVENSFITSLPSTLVPYLNAWVGIDKPQPLANGNGAGLLRNTGINFETDALTGFPKLDDTANNTYGAAAGVSYLFNLDQQIVGEVAALRTLDAAAGRAAPGNQYAFGLRYQIPISSAWIVRTDAMYGILNGAEDVFGARMELRLKF